MSQLKNPQGFERWIGRPFENGAAGLHVAQVLDQFGGDDFTRRDNRSGG
jgi:hypothetical protein